MVEIEIKKFFFKKKNIWFCNSPFDVMDCDAVFFFVCKNKVSLDGFIRKEDHTFIIDLSRDLDYLWGRIAKSMRNYINRSKKLGIKFKINEDYEKFENLYYSFVQQKGFTPPSEPYSIMMRYGTLFNAYYRDELIAGTLTIDDTHVMREYIGASKRLDPRVEPEMSKIVSIANKALIWEGIVHAKKIGKHIYDLGGYSPTEDENDPAYRIRFFKERFGGIPVTYYKYAKYYSWLYRLSKKVASVKHDIKRSFKDTL